MKTKFTGILAAVIMLSASMCSRVAEKKGKDVTPQYESEGNYNWKENMTIAERKRDAAGMLLPLQSYEETILRGMSFLLEDHLKWFKGPAKNLIDEMGETQMPYSTFEEKKPGGFRDKSGIMPDKGAIMGLAYLELYKASGETRFLQAAEAIAQTLVRNQRIDGTWPFRVDPKTKEVVEEYTSSVIYAIRLFETLDEIYQTHTYRAHRDLTWEWLSNGPIKTKEFRGFYEDIPESTEGRTNYDCLDVIRYLLANRTDNNGYLEMALELNAWVEEIFKDPIEGFEPAEGIREQLQCNVVMGIHSLNWASMLKVLAEASGDAEMMERTMQTANYVTYYQQPDNRIVVGFEYNQWWYSCHIGVIYYLFDFLEVS